MPGLIQITAPPVTSALAALADAKEDIGLSATDTTNDARLGRLIARASSVIEQFCNRQFGVVSVTETFRFGFIPGQGPAGQTVAPYGTPINTQYKPLVLGVEPPIAAILAITENAATLDPTQDFEVDPDSGLVWRLRSGNRSWWNPPLVVVTYQAGYVLPQDALPPPVAAPTLPAVVVDSCLSLVRSGWFAQTRDPNVAMDMLNGDRTQFWDRSLSPMVVDEDMADNLADFCGRVF